jgi:Mitochondrial carrier protein
MVGLPLPCHTFEEFPTTNQATRTVQGLLKAKGGPLSFLAAGAAGASSTALLYPLEVVRSRMTVNSTRYPGPWRALREIGKHEGASALYRGLPASVASIIPEAAITYGGLSCTSSLPVALSRMQLCLWLHIDATFVVACSKLTTYCGKCTGWFYLIVLTAW